MLNRRPQTLTPTGPHPKGWGYKNKARLRGLDDILGMGPLKWPWELLEDGAIGGLPTPVHCVTLPVWALIVAIIGARWRGSDVLRL